MEWLNNPQMDDGGTCPKSACWSNTYCPCRGGHNDDTCPSKVFCFNLGGPCPKNLVCIGHASV